MASGNPPVNGRLKARIPFTAFAFRGYDVKNLGRTAELLAHDAYGPVVERHLRAANELYCEFTGTTADLVERVRTGTETTLDAYGEAIALIVAVELAQLELLEQFHGISFQKAKLATGYSLGEVAVLVATGVYPLASVLQPLLELSQDIIELTHGVQMGIVFSRGPLLDSADVTRLCLKISNEGNGILSVSSYLSPNTLLLMGQGNTLARFKREMRTAFPRTVHLRINEHQWPPIHTLISRQRSIPNRASVIMDTVEGGFQAPSMLVVSCVTGKSDYTDYNSREILAKWVDQPQRLWDVVDRILAEGVDTIVHVGPEPNIIPATFERLANNVTTQLNQSSLSSFGLRAVSELVNRYRPWLASMLSKRATLLRAPFIEHVILEDWLLEHDPVSSH